MPAHPGHLDVEEDEIGPAPAIPRSASSPSAASPTTRIPSSSERSRRSRSRAGSSSSTRKAWIMAPAPSPGPWRAADPSRFRPGLQREVQRHHGHAPRLVPADAQRRPLAEWPTRRSRTLRNPYPEEPGGLGGCSRARLGEPRARCRGRGSTRESDSRSASISMRPVPRIAATPCLTAFSTRVCTARLGMRASAHRRIDRTRHCSRARSGPARGPGRRARHPSLPPGGPSRSPSAAGCSGRPPRAARRRDRPRPGSLGISPAIAFSALNRKCGLIWARSAFSSERLACNDRACSRCSCSSRRRCSRTFSSIEANTSASDSSTSTSWLK